MLELNDFFRLLEIVIWPITVSRLVRVVLQWLMDLHTEEEEEEEEQND